MGLTIKSLKKTLNILNITLGLIGITFVIFGIIGKCRLGQEPMLRNFSFNYLQFILFGHVMILVGVFGLRGISKENGCFLLTYSVLLLIVSGVEVVMALIAFFRLQELTLEVQTQFKEIFMSYTINKDIKKYVNHLQLKFSCCGYEGPSYWGQELPASCCTVQENCTTSSRNLHPNACKGELGKTAEYNVTVIGVIVISLALFQCLSALIAFYLHLVVIRNRFRGRLLR